MKKSSISKFFRIRVFKIINYLADKRAKQLLEIQKKMHMQQRTVLNDGFTKTMSTFRMQSEDRISMLTTAHDEALTLLNNETNKKIKSITDESHRIQSEMNSTIELYGKAIQKLTEIEDVYHKFFSQVDVDLKKVLPQLRAALGMSIHVISGLEKALETTSEKISSKKKQAAELIQVNHLKGR